MDQSLAQVMLAISPCKTVCRASVLPIAPIVPIVTNGDTELNW